MLTADGLWPTSASSSTAKTTTAAVITPATLMEQWGVGGNAQTGFALKLLHGASGAEAASTTASQASSSSSRPSTFAKAPLASDIPGRRTAVNAGSRHAGQPVSFSSHPDLVRLPTGVLISPAASPAHRKRQVRGGEKVIENHHHVLETTSTANHALTDHLTFTEMGLTSTDLPVNSPPRGSSSSVAAGHALLMRSSDGAAMGLKIISSAAESSATTAFIIPTSGLVAGQGRARFYSRELKGDGARELLTAPPPERTNFVNNNALWRSEASAPEAAARFTTQTRASFTGKMEGGPAIAPLRRRGLAAPPASIVGTAAFPTRATAIY